MALKSTERRVDELELNKQDILVSGVTIKTINGNSVLGSGNLTVGGSATWGSITGTLSTQTDLQSALDAKQDDLISGTNIKTLEGQSLLGAGNIDLTKSDVGLSNVDNTSDLNKPISTATQTALNAKENTITAGTTSQYFRGDKTFQTLDKTAVGLGNVDNTSDLNKPISTLTQTALNAKQNTLTLTTTGTSGAATLVGATLNIPQYGGGLTVGTTPIASGTVGRILFQNGGDVLGQDSSLFWDNTNKRLGIGATPATTVRLDVRAQGALSTDIALRVRNSADTRSNLTVNGLGQTRLLSNSFSGNFFTISYVADNSVERDAFIFTQNVQNAMGQAWTFDAGYNGVQERLTISNNLTGNNQGIFSIHASNFCFGTTILNSDNTADRRVLRIATGVAPTTSFTDGFKFYSADITAGNAAPHFRTENGNIIKLFQGAALTASDGTLANAVTRIAEIQARLQAHGLIA